MNKLNKNEFYLVYNNQMSLKQLSEAKQAIKKQLQDLDSQIHQLQGYYIQDTRQFGNLLKGFQNYVAAKTARNQPTNKKQKVETYQRIFSLSSIKSKTSETYEESIIGGQPKMESSQINNTKRNRNRASGGMTKMGGGKNLMGRQDINQFDDDNGISQDNGYSVDESNMKGVSKRKKITKSGSSGKGVRKM